MHDLDNGITCFVRLLTLGEDRREINPRLRLQIPERRNVDFSLHERTFYSYGRHFPLARYVPLTKKANGRALWVINGDTWPRRGWSMTSDHQRETRAAIARAIEDAGKRGIEVSSIIIPFTAMGGAGIVVDSVRPIHVRGDRNEVFDNVATLPMPFLTRPLPTFEECETAAREEWEKGGGYWPNGRPGWESVSGSLPIQGNGTITPAVQLTMTRTSRDTGAVDTWTRTGKLSRHVYYQWHTGYGATSEWRRSDFPKVTYWFDGSHELEIVDAESTADTATVRFTTSRHWLGDSLFRATIRTSRRVPCPNHVGTRAPDSVNVWCDTCGQMVTADGIAPAMTITRERRMRFLSSFDYNERAPLYFLAALPATSRARTVEMAFEDLAPAAVHAAYARGLAVQRQGDVFFIPTPLTSDDVYARAERRARLTQWTRQAKPRPGEVGYATPLPPAAVKARREMIRTETLAGMRADMAADVRPTTAAGFRRDKRRKLAEIAERRPLHVLRVQHGDDVCKCRNHYGASDGTACATCGLPVWYHGYTAGNAERQIGICDEETVKILAEPRRRGKGYAAEMPIVGYRRGDGTYANGDKYGKCYRRAIRHHEDAIARANAKWSPRIDYDAIRATLAVFGTSHTATEVAVCKGGVTYVRGIARHVPAVAGERRQRDHADITLGNGQTWFLAIRNTVPRQ